MPKKWHDVKCMNLILLSYIKYACHIHTWENVISHLCCRSHTYIWENGIFHLVACPIRTYEKMVYLTWLHVTYVHIRTCYISPDCPSHTYIWENGMSHLVACHIRTYKDMLYLTWLPVTYVHIRTCYISPGSYFYIHYVRVIKML
jgi:hypothetical protein